MKVLSNAHADAQVAGAGRAAVSPAPQPAAGRVERRLQAFFLSSPFPGEMLLFSYSESWTVCLRLCCRCWGHPAHTAGLEAAGQRGGPCSGGQWYVMCGLALCGPRPPSEQHLLLPSPKASIDVQAPLPGTLVRPCCSPQTAVSLESGPGAWGWQGLRKLPPSCPACRRAACLSDLQGCTLAPSQPCCPPEPPVLKGLGSCLWPEAPRYQSGGDGHMLRPPSGPPGSLP